MSYLDQSRRASPGSMAAVVAIHAALGLAIVTGLTVSGVIRHEDGPIIAIDPYDPPPPPPPTTPPPPDAASPTDPVIAVPIPPLNIPNPRPDIRTTTDLVEPPLSPLPHDPGPVVTLPVPVPVPEPVPSFTPKAAVPRNNPGSWLSDADYRPAWIRQELAGTARFRLEIAANGRVTGCQVTGSTGAPALDTATCDLVSKRARFEPARGANGEAIGGTYIGVVRWRLPE